MLHQIKISIKYNFHVWGKNMHTIKIIRKKLYNYVTKKSFQVDFFLTVQLSVVTYKVIFNILQYNSLNCKQHKINLFSIMLGA